MNKTTILIILGIIVAVGGVVGHRYYSGTSFIASISEVKYELATVQKGTLIQEVSASGKVAPPTTIDLQFRNSGKLVQLKAVRGKKVKAGELLAQQGGGILAAQLSEMLADIDVAKAQLKNYQAALRAQEAKLEELKRGSRPEEIQVAASKVSNAELALADAKVNSDNIKVKAELDLVNLYDGVLDLMNDAFIKADDALNKQIDAMFYNDNITPTLTFTALNPQKGTNIESRRPTAGQALAALKTLAASDTDERERLDNALSSSKTQLVIIRDFLNQLNDVVREAGGLTQTIIDSYRYNVTVALTNINAVLTSINTKQQAIASQKVINQNNLSAAAEKLNNAESALTSARDELKLKQVGSATEQIAAQEAQAEQAGANITLQEARIKQTQASAERVKAQIEELILTAPIAGVITEVNGEIGEIIKPEAIVVSMMPSGNLQIDADISEADIVEIKVNQEAKITLDAFDDEVSWPGKVAKIDPAETIVGGAIYYKTTVLFVDHDERIKPGMTANIRVEVVHKENALYIPLTAIKEKRGEKITDSRLYPYVEVLEGSQVKEKEVQTGIKGEGGVIEIISGLNEGEQIILSPKKK